MTLFNPNLHGPLKLLNHHGIDGKTWFKEQGPLWVHGRDYKVAPTVFPLFSDCSISHAPPSSQYWKKNTGNTRDFMLYLNTLKMLRSLQKTFPDGV